MWSHIRRWRQGSLLSLQHYCMKHTIGSHSRIRSRGQRPCVRVSSQSQVSIRKLDTHELHTAIAALASLELTSFLEFPSVINVALRIRANVTSLRLTGLTKKKKSQRINSSVCVAFLFSDFFFFSKWMMTKSKSNVYLSLEWRWIHLLDTHIPIWHLMHMDQKHNICVGTGHQVHKGGAKWLWRSSFSSSLWVSNVTSSHHGSSAKPTAKTSSTHKEHLRERDQMEG